MTGCEDTRTAPFATDRKTTSLRPFWLLAPTLLTITLLFGGGLGLGFLQALGYLPGQGLNHIDFHHFFNIFHDPDFFRSLVISLYISITSTLIGTAISITLALILTNQAAQHRFFHFILQIPLTVPHLVVAIAVILLLSPSGLFAKLFSSLGLIGSPADFPLLINDKLAVGIILVYIWKEVPFITFMLLAVLKNNGPELNEVGATLNGSRTQRFFHITLPIIAPSLGASSLIVFAFTLGAFEVPYLLGRTYPVPLPVQAYKNFSDIDLLTRPEGIGMGMVLAAIIILIIIFCYCIVNISPKSCGQR